MQRVMYLAIAALVVAAAAVAPASPLQAATRPSGRLALAGNGIDVIDLGTRQDTRVRDEWASNVAWSADGSKLAYSTWTWATQTTIETVKPDGTARRTLVAMDGKTTMTTWPTWSPDGKRLAFTVDRSVIATGTAHSVLELWTVNADGRGLRRVTTPAGDAPDEAAWSPDGRRIAYTAVTPGPLYTTRLSTIKVLDLARGTATTVAQGSQAAWSPDGLRIAFVAPDEGIEVVNLVTHKVKRLAAGRGGFAYDEHPTFSPDGRWVAFGTDADPTSPTAQDAQIWIAPADGSKPPAPLGFNGWYWAAWGPRRGART